MGWFGIRSCTLVVAVALAAAACTTASNPTLERVQRPAPETEPASQAAAEPPPEPEPSAASEPEPGGHPPQPQLRGMWIHLFDDTLKTPEGIDRMLDAAVAAGVNTVIPEVVRRHDAYYASDVLPRTADPDLAPGLDVLDHVLRGASERGLAVHAWFPAMPAHHHTYDDLPDPDGWVWGARGPSAPEPERWVTRHHDGRWGDYLDPGVPAVQDHVAAIAGEIAERYPVDAVHADYLRYPGQEWGYHPVALERFRAETGRTDRPAPTDPQWSDWRRQQTRALAARVRDAVRAARPSAGVSIAAFTAGEGPHAGRSFSETRPYSRKFQDWPGWVRDGLVDAVFPMNYFREDRHTAYFNQWLGHHQALAAETDAVVAVGVGAWLNPAPAGEAQIARALTGTDGAVVYSYQQSANAEPYGALLERLGGGLWAEPAPPPPLRR